MNLKQRAGLPIIRDCLILQCEKHGKRWEDKHKDLINEAFYNIDRYSSDNVADYLIKGWNRLRYNRYKKNESYQENLKKYYKK